MFVRLLLVLDSAGDSYDLKAQSQRLCWKRQNCISADILLVSSLHDHACTRVVCSQICCSVDKETLRPKTGGFIFPSRELGSEPCQGGVRVSQSLGREYWENGAWDEQTFFRTTSPSLPKKQWRDDRNSLLSLQLVIANYAYRQNVQTLMFAIQQQTGTIKIAQHNE